METLRTESLDVLVFGGLSRMAGLRHFVSTRIGGFSPPPYDSLNLGLHVEDADRAVIRNREGLASSIGAPLRYLTFAKQVHGSRVAVITEQMRGLGSSDYASAIDDTDAMVTDVPDICLVVLVADCVPILFHDPRRGVIGVAHAGWKGTAGGIAARVVDAMTREYGSDPAGILAGIGPSIGPCCYEVGEQVIDAFRSDSGLLTRHGGHTHLDLWQANRTQLLSVGVPDASIEVARICTCCNADRFYSYRKHGVTGRFGAGIMIMNEMCASCTAIHCNWCSKP